jgi:NAD(P)-dependent dehydrogenase (short-subunit alcohol dehydrogenase family)
LRSSPRRERHRQGNLRAPIGAKAPRSWSPRGRHGQAVSFFGRVDALVSNAGIQIGAPIEDFDFAKWKQMLAIHLDGAFLTTRAALKQKYRSSTQGVVLTLLPSRVPCRSSDWRAWRRAPWRRPELSVVRLLISARSFCANGEQVQDEGINVRAAISDHMPAGAKKPVYAPYVESRRAMLLRSSDSRTAEPVAIEDKSEEEPFWPGNGLIMFEDGERIVGAW